MKTPRPSILTEMRGLPSEKSIRVYICIHDIWLFLGGGAEPLPGTQHRSFTAGARYPHFTTARILNWVSKIKCLFRGFATINFASLEDDFLQCSGGQPMLWLQDRGREDWTFPDLKLFLVGWGGPHPAFGPVSLQSSLLSPLRFRPAYI